MFAALLDQHVRMALTKNTPTSSYKNNDCEKQGVIG